MQSGDVNINLQIHEMEGGNVTDLQWSPDRTYFITASRDKSAKVNTIESESCEMN